MKMIIPNIIAGFYLADTIVLTVLHQKSITTRVHRQKKQYLLPVAYLEPRKSSSCAYLGDNAKDTPMSMIQAKKENRLCVNQSRFLLDMVPLTGLEPVRSRPRGIFLPHYVTIAAR